MKFEFALRRSVGACVLATALLVPFPAFADTYPTKTIRMIVPFAPGGATDVLARIVCEQIGTALGGQCIVENKSGAGGNLGSDMVAKADPDGYTLLFGAAGNIAINPSLFADMPYDPQRDLAPVSVVASTMNVLVVNPSVPAKSVRELIALAKAKPGTLNFASSGNGGTIHLSGEMFKSMAGIDIIHVPYRGSGPAMVDLLGGRTQLMFDNLPSALPRVQAGALRALAVTAKTRSASLPDVPTMAEAGLPEFEATTWFGVLAPAHTPSAIVTRLNEVVVAAMKKPGVIEKVRALGAEPTTSTPQAFAELIRNDTARWRAVIKSANVKLD